MIGEVKLIIHSKMLSKWMLFIPKYVNLKLKNKNSL